MTARRRRVGLRWKDLRPSCAGELRAVLDRLLCEVVSTNRRTTGRERQLNQLVNLLLAKLESDLRARRAPEHPVAFQPHSDPDATARAVRRTFHDAKVRHADAFCTDADGTFSLDAATLHVAATWLGPIRLVEAPVDALSTALQVVRSEHVKADAGQYLTPLPVARSAALLLGVDGNDVIVDPACGAGSFLIELARLYRERHPRAAAEEVERWCGRHIHGVDKDAVSVKLAKVIMTVAGGGSERVQWGDSLRTPVLDEGRYTLVVTNPPFGKGLKLAARDAERAGYTICLKPRRKSDGSYRFEPDRHVDRELGLAFLEKAWRLSTRGGRVGIVLPETYFFSASYRWITDWLVDRLVLRGMFNIPMEAFQGFCRAKTNFYVFQKV